MQRLLFLIFILLASNMYSIKAILPDKITAALAVISVSGAAIALTMPYNILQCEEGIEHSQIVDLKCSIASILIYLMLKTIVGFVASISSAVLVTQIAANNFGQ